MESGPRSHSSSTWNPSSQSDQAAVVDLKRHSQGCPHVGTRMPPRASTPYAGPHKPLVSHVRPRPVCPGRLTRICRACTHTQGYRLTRICRASHAAYTQVEERRGTVTLSFDHAPSALRGLRLGESPRTSRPLPLAHFRVSCSWPSPAHSDNPGVACLTQSPWLAGMLIAIYSSIVDTSSQTERHFPARTEPLHVGHGPGRGATTQVRHSTPPLGISESQIETCTPQ
jgi:hypothetical protein